MEALHAGLLDLSVVAFAVSSMSSVGFAYTLQEILEPLRNVRGIIRAVVASFVLVPGGLVLKPVDGLENGRPAARPGAASRTLTSTLRSRRWKASKESKTFTTCMRGA